MRMDSNRTSNSARSRLRSRPSRTPHSRQNTGSFSRERNYASRNGRYTISGNSSRVPQLMSSSKQEQAMRRNIMRKNSRVIQSLPIIALILVIIAVIFGIIYFNGTIQ